ncbi:unnamed protein product [Prunus armeniaca]
MVLIFWSHLDWQHANTDLAHKPIRSLATLSWQYPAAGVTKINTDGCQNGETSRIAAGAVLRSSSGMWIKGFAANIGYGQVLDAELWGIFYGLKSAWDMGCSDVVLESDSAIAVHLLNKTVDALHPLATLLWGCQDYIKKCWGCSIYHVYCECNMVADRLANLGSCLDLGL